MANLNKPKGAPVRWTEAQMRDMARIDARAVLDARRIWLKYAPPEWRALLR